MIVKNMLYVLMLFSFFSIQLKSFDQKENADMSKWHPEAFYIVYPDMKIFLKFPYEKERSGVANLFFINNDTKCIRLLDTVKNNRRYYNRLSGLYDVVLLYNNGNYIKYNDVLFEKNANIILDMEKYSLQPCDSESQNWLTLRTFNTTIGNKKREISKEAISERKIRGYVFIEDGAASEFSLAGIPREITKSNGLPACSFDGYFEVDVSDESFLTLEIFHPGHNFEYLNVKGTSKNH